MAMNNSLAEVRSELVPEWSEKNLTLQPDEVNAKSRKNVWWKCRKCGNEWKSVINARVKGTVLPKNMLILLLFIQLVYVGIRWYVKGWRETRGYY